MCGYGQRSEGGQCAQGYIGDAEHEQGSVRHQQGRHRQKPGMYSLYSIINTWVVRTSINEDISSTVLTFFKRVETEQKDLKIIFEKDNYDFDLDGADTFTSPIATTDPEGKKLSYSSSNNFVAEVDAESGEVTIKNRGIVTITASFEGDEEYGATSASYKLRVDKSNDVGEMNNPMMASEAYDGIAGNKVQC